MCTVDDVRAKRSSEANELSKGAIRALKAQAKQAEIRASPEWTDASAPSSRQISLEPDESVAGDDDARAMAGMMSHEKQLLQFQNGQHGIMMQQTQMPFGVMSMGAVNGVNLGAWAPAMQTYAYPEQDNTCKCPKISGGSKYLGNWTCADNSVGQMSMPFAYAQPSQPEFYSYDQALPFSPSAHTFSFSQVQPQAQQQQQVWSHDQSSFPMEKSTSLQGSGLDATLPVPPMTARWGATFQTGTEGSAYGDMQGMQGQNPMLQDFGAALMQAEEMLGWA